jgi:hypothetical protein
MFRYFLLLLCHSCVSGFSQAFPHPNAHAHNDYEHAHPLKDAWQNRFASVEADVHLQNGNLLVSHDTPKKGAPSLEDLYFAPLDSMVKANGHVYPGNEMTFFLMIDCKTEAGTYEAIRKAVSKHPDLICRPGNCPVRIFLSGNRPFSTIVSEGYSGIGLDGRPEDLGKGYSAELMPVISDHYKNWSVWNGRSDPSSEDLQRVKALARRVHAEGKKLRLWAIPDNEKAWAALLEAGVDLINTDHLQRLNDFLIRKGL